MVKCLSVRVFIDGEVFDESCARISVFDRGFLYGDSVYEVMRTVAGWPVELEAHLARLDQSAAAIHLSPPSGEYLECALRDTLSEAGNEESYVRVIVTRGAGDIGLDIALARDPVTVVIVRELRLPEPSLYQLGIAIRFVGVQRWSKRALDPRVKSGNYLNNILALAEARAVGAYEAVMCDAEGRITEGSSSNVFFVFGDEIKTPSLDMALLPGITRQRVIELARSAGLAVSETRLRPEQVAGADEAFITSSIRGVLPVATIDGNRVPSPPPLGPVARRVMGLYAEFLKRQAQD